MGYDPEKWVETDLSLDRSMQHRRNYTRLVIPPPVKGVHKYKFCQKLYEEIHGFLHQREWAPVNPEDNVAGITWMELFVLFDISGLRTKQGEHVLDLEVRQRAGKRKAEKTSKEDLPRNYTEHAAILRPALDAELARFKAIVRHIARHELDDLQADMFMMDDCTQFRRLAKLGIYGHQPGVAAHVKTNQEEEQGIVEGLLAQKVGSNPKNHQACRDFLRAKMMIVG